MLSAGVIFHKLWWNYIKPVFGWVGFKMLLYNLLYLGGSETPWVGLDLKYMQQKAQQIQVEGERWDFTFKGYKKK